MFIEGEPLTYVWLDGPDSGQVALRIYRKSGEFVIRFVFERDEVAAAKEFFANLN